MKNEWKEEESEGGQVIKRNEEEGKEGKEWN